MNEIIFFSRMNKNEYFNKEERNCQIQNKWKIQQETKKSILDEWKWMKDSARMKEIRNFSWLKENKKFPVNENNCILDTNDRMNHSTRMKEIRNFSWMKENEKFVENERNCMLDTKERMNHSTRMIETWNFDCIKQKEKLTTIERNLVTSPKWNWMRNSWRMKEKDKQIAMVKRSRCFCLLKLVAENQNTSC